jgi:hypothetical protein
MADSNHVVATGALNQLNDDNSPQPGGRTGSPATAIGTHY